MAENAPIQLEGDEAWVAVGERLRRAREYLGMSQSEVATTLRVSRSAVTQIEAGKRKVSGLELAQLSRLYGLSYDELLGQSKAPEDETLAALYRATKSLTETDREQVLRFAQFLRNAGAAPPAGGAEG